MAILIPDCFDPDAGEAVRDVFNRLHRDQELRGWMCFHSLSMMRQRRRRETDPDFVLLGPEGILVIKVRQGLIRRTAEGQWQVPPAKPGQKPVALDHGPFKETAAALLALRGALTHSFGAETDSVLFGFGVMFPDVPVLEAPTREWDPEIVYQGIDRLYPIHVYIRRLVDYWKRTKPGKSDIPGSQLEKYEHYLRANFEVSVPLTSITDPDSSELVWFTREQCQALDLMAENDRVLCGGSAGTGKTFLALEQARRLASRGKKTLVLCQNSLLGDYLGRVFSQPNYKGLVSSHSVLRYFDAVIRGSSLATEYAAEGRKTSGSSIYYQYFLRAVNEVGVEKFDALIVDQGQEALNADTLFAFDFVLKGGFECGNWYVFHDNSRRPDFPSEFDTQVLPHLDSFGPAEVQLPTNCRTTQNIALQTSIVTGFPMAPAFTEGDKVKYRWYDDPESQIKDLKKVVTVLLNEGLKPEALTILYPGGQTYLRDGLRGLRLKAPLVELGISATYPPEEGKVTFASIQAFKGLENRFVIVLGIDKIGEPWLDSLSYAGMSRARLMLFVFMHSRVREEYEAHVAQAMSRERKE